jgi:hypothetical protein
MRIKHRLAKLELRLAVELRPKKRGVPDWLQSDLESHGYIFDVYGYLISAPDPLRYEGSAGQPDERDHRLLYPEQVPAPNN